jgi:hypothetical protein
MWQCVQRIDPEGHDLPFPPVTYLPLLAANGHRVIVAGILWRYPA